MEYKRRRGFSRNCGELRFNINCLRTCYDAQAPRHATFLHGSSSLRALSLNVLIQSAEPIRFQAYFLIGQPAN